MSKQVKTWLREHNQTVQREARTGKCGVRIIPCWLPTKSPWLNRIEPKWVHGKRAIVEPARLLTATEHRPRVCDYFGCEQAELLPQKVASCYAKQKLHHPKRAKMEQPHPHVPAILLITDREGECHELSRMYPGEY